MTDSFSGRLGKALAPHKYSVTVGIILLAHIVLVFWGGRRAIMFTPVVLLAMYLLGFVFLLVRERSLIARLNLIVGLTALGLSCLNMFFEGGASLVMAVACHFLFLFLLIVFMLGQLFRKKAVTVDTIMAGVIIYLLMAGLWAQLYALTLLIDPAAIHYPVTHGGQPYMALYYFSVTTLTTAGFGDVVPVSDLARIVAAYESLIGQVYLATFVALLMGRHFANR
ncbi:MAG: ion channel [Desulfovibrionaceae bacterium]